MADVANILARRARALGKPCGAAVFPTPRMAAGMVRQDWSRFDLDFAFPMTYMSFYNKDTQWILDCVRESRQAIDDRFPIFPGLFLPDFTPGEFQRLLPDLLKVNPRGFCLFSHNDFSKEHQRVVKEILQDQNNYSQEKTKDE